MTYKIYLKSDYKPVVRRVPARPWYLNPRLIIWGFTGFLVSSTVSLIWTISPNSTDEYETVELIPIMNTEVKKAVFANIKYTSTHNEHIPVSIPSSILKTSSNPFSEK